MYNPSESIDFETLEEYLREQERLQRIEWMTELRTRFEARRNAFGRLGF